MGASGLSASGGLALRVKIDEKKALSILPVGYNILELEIL
jgi:hypothetical protein